MTIYKVQLKRNDRVFDKKIHIDNKTKNPEATLKSFLKSYEKEGFKIVQDGLKGNKDNIIAKAKNVVKGTETINPAKREDFFATSDTITIMIAVRKVLIR